MDIDAKRVKDLGEEIGYGHMMALASALWRKDLKSKGYPTSGAFIPVCRSEEGLTMVQYSERDIYDDLVK